MPEGGSLEMDFAASLGYGTGTGPVGKIATKHFRMLIHLFLL